MLALASLLFSATASAQARFSGGQVTLGGGFSNPEGVAVDGSGNVYVADTSNSAVKEMPADCASSSCVKSLSFGFLPFGVAVDRSGNVYVADQEESAVMEMPAGCASSSCVRWLGGGFELPVGVAVDGSGNVYVADLYNYADDVYDDVVYEMPPGCASSSCVTALGGGFGAPGGVAVDGSGNVYVADSYNSAVKEMPPGCASSSCVNTLDSATFGPVGVAVDANGNVYVADSGNNRILQVAPTGGNFGTVNVETTSTAIPMIFVFDSETTLGATAVLAQGVTDLDFTDAGTGSCTAGTAYAAGDTCTVDVTFKPAAPGLRKGAAVLYNHLGGPIAIGYVWGVGSGPQAVFPGAAPATYISGLNVPLGIAVDEAGDLLIANSQGPNVLFVALGGSSQTTGSGFVMPTAVAVDGAGNIFVADNDAAVYEIAKTSNTQTQLSIPGLTDPEYLSIDGAGNLYITEPSAHTVLKVTPSGAQTTVGTGLSDPRGTTEDGAGNVYIIDYSEGAVITVPPAGPQSAVYGLGGPTGVAVDAAGNIYVADFGNATLLLITPSGAVSTIDANAFQGPWDVAMDGSGNLYLTDYQVGEVHKIDLADAPSLTFAATASGETSADSPQTVTITNIGNAPLLLPIPTAGDNPSISANFTLNTDVPSACPFVTSASTGHEWVFPAESCSLSVSFTPAAAGPLTGSLVLTDNTLNAAPPGYATQTIGLSGTATSRVIATLTSPVAGTTLGSSASLTWTAGTGVTAYWLNLGTSPSGAGAKNIFSSGSIGETFATVSGLPEDGVTVYATLYSFLGGSWIPAQYTFTETGTPAPAVLMSPNAGTALGTTTTFKWSPGTGVTAYWFNLGYLPSGEPAKDIYNSGPITSTSVTVPGLVEYGVTVYATLYSYIDGVWLPAQYTFTETGTPVPATLTSPSPGSTLPGSDATFTWTQGGGVGAYWLNLGTDTSNAGAKNIYTGGGTNLTSATVTGLPTGGETIYATLYSYINGSWQPTVYTFKTAP